MRKTRRYLLVTLLIAVLGVASWLLLRPDPEPTYHGKPLTYWLDAGVNDNPPPSQTDAIEAVKQIGTNAIPTLLRMFQAKDSNFKLKLIQLSSEQHLINFKWRTAESKQFEALMAFLYLGPDAKSAVPDLIKLLSDPSPDVSAGAKAALQKINPEAAAKAGVK